MSSGGLNDLVPPGVPSPAGTLDRARLRRDIAAIAAYVAARGGGHWLLHEPYPFRFAACLYGVTLGGGGITLLPDVRPGTLSALDGTYTGQLGTPVDAACHVSVDTIVDDPQSPGGLPDVPPGTVTVLTSGTTGNRKQLARELDDLLGEAAALQQKWPLDDGIIVASMVSHHHMYGLAFGIVWPLAHRAHLLTAKQSPVPDFATLDNRTGRKVRLVTSPTYLHRFEASIGLANFADGNRREAAMDCAFSAGAPLDADRAAAVSKRWDCPINEIYGSSETGAVATRRAAVDAAWEALPGADLRVEGQRLLIDAPYMARGLARPFVSPDRVEADGVSFRLLGRTDRVVKVEGKRVSLQHIEDAVLALDWVDACAAVLLDGERSHVAVAVVPSKTGCSMLHRDGKTSTDKRLRHALVQDLEAVMVPRRIRYLCAIPASPEGKVDNDRLRLVFADNARSRPTVHGVVATAGGVQIDLALEPDLRAFEGHFPGHGILPGVALLHWVILLAHEYLDTPLHAVSLPSIKFTSTLAPSDRLQLELSRGKDCIDYQCACAGVTASKGRINIHE